ncbi:hypothetical protein [Streptomyces erythrochromogenes]|uniref:hypothetical protein n=1 Tax=Streptomyces erythrochromogenes TaxID=285574 RepID=UPI0022580D1C|nr:hypothetical protein [Streptomyces erythrochromogenes]MCX5585713.1 hypothetical protein [Streptomyces erythrochromogenes]
MEKNSVIIKQAAERVVLVRPGPGLLHAAVEAGLDVWVVSDPGAWPQDAGLPTGLPPERILRTDFDDAAALRILLTDTGSATCCTSRAISGRASAAVRRPPPRRC